MKQFIQNLAGQHQSCPDQTKAGISTTMESASSSSSGTAVVVVRSQLPTTQTGQGSLPHLGARPGPYMALLAAPALSAPISGQLAPPPHLRKTIMSTLSSWFKRLQFPSQTQYDGLRKQRWTQLNIGVNILHVKDSTQRQKQFASQYMS